MTDRRKLLWHSNAPHAPTGYGNQTALFCPPLAQHYDLRISAFYGLEGAPLVWEDIVVMPGMGATFGNEALPLHVSHWFEHPRDGLVVTLMDVWVLAAEMAKQMNMACWVPVDHDPVPPMVFNFFAQSGAVPIAMSRFGEQRLAAFDPLYVPHAVDTRVFRPYDRAQARDDLGIDQDTFLIGIVAANKGNPSRKGFVPALQAFAEFRKRHDNAKLLLHSDLAGTWAAGVPLVPLLESLNIPEGAVQATDGYRIHFHPVPPPTMAKMYSAMDVLLNPATGEGFGIPVLEAQACGTPVIVTDFSAMQEVCGSGWKVDGERMWTTQQAWQVNASTGEIVAALSHCYQLPEASRAQMSKQAREHALKYDVGRVLDEHMLPALEEAHRRFEERKPLDVVSRTRRASAKRKQAAA